MGVLYSLIFLPPSFYGGARLSSFFFFFFSYGHTYSLFINHQYFLPFLFFSSSPLCLILVIFAFSSLWGRFFCDTFFFPSPLQTPSVVGVCWTYSPCPSVVHIRICSHGSYLVYSVDICCVPSSQSITFTCRVLSLRSCQQRGPAKIAQLIDCGPSFRQRSSKIILTTTSIMNV